MSVAEQIGSQLQYLRRYARALTGTQSSGDAYVAAMLETLIESPDTFDSTEDPKVECFRIFSHLWNSIKANTVPESADTEWEQIASKKLDRITPMARQVFLLQAVEGFNTKQISKIIGEDEDEDEVVSLLNQASAEIAEQVMSKVLIIEDEPLIAMDIEALVTDLGHTVTGIARTHREAVALAMDDPPGMVLADIQLADGSSGIEAVNEILQSFDVPVIFITAFPERLLTGEKPEPAFLLTKPFLPEMVKAIMSQALFFEVNAGRTLETSEKYAS